VSVKTDGLITSELIIIADYRALGLSNSRINKPSDYWTLGLSTYNQLITRIKGGMLKINNVSFAE